MVMAKYGGWKIRTTITDETTLKAVIAVIVSFPE